MVVTLLAAVGGRLQLPASQDTAGLTSALCALRDSATHDVVAVEVLWSPQVGHMLRLCQVKFTRHYHCQWEGFLCSRLTFTLGSAPKLQPQHRNHFITKGCRTLNTRTAHVT